MSGRARVSAIVIALALLGALVLAVIAGSATALARGWLVAFAIWSAVPIGSMTLLLIHRLTGGGWGEALAPVLQPAAAILPLVAIGFLPLLVGIGGVYPWAGNPSAAGTGVAGWYLNTPFYIIRALVALAGWSLLGLVFARGGGSRLFAALGLAFHGLIISLIAIDWYLSVDPKFTSTAFGATIAIQQLLAALAFAAVVAPVTLTGKALGDLAGLIIATLLGVVYLELMTFIVSWYGDLPEKAAWYLNRGEPVWAGTLIAALVTGALLPFSLLLFHRARRSRFALRVAGSLALIGSGLHFVWLLVPAFDREGLTVAFGALSLVVLTLGSVSFGLAGSFRRAAHAG